MEDSESRARSRRQREQGEQEEQEEQEEQGEQEEQEEQEEQGEQEEQEEQGGPELLSSEPWRRFMPKAPKSLGIVILMFGCAEFIMGLTLGGDPMDAPYVLYTPFWQGTLVTGCLVMYVVSFIGGLVSVFSRLFYVFMAFIGLGMAGKPTPESWRLILRIEAILMINSVCVLLILLIHILILCCALLCALKSTVTEIVLHQIVAPVTETPTE